MTSKDLSIFNSLRPFSIGFDDMFDQFENMLGNGGLSMQSNYPPYNIRKAGKDKYAIEVALAGFNKKDVEVEFEEFGNAKKNKEHFDYIYSYAPYNNIKKMDYPHMLITTSLSDNRVLFDEPAKFTAKLREFKTDNNLLLLKTEMNAGHGGRSGRDSAIEEIAIDYAFALKISKKINS